jgi:hypothetical protein
MAHDFGQSYRVAREEISRLAVTHDSSVMVPATPLWSIHDVCAHVAGAVEDGRTGNVAGAPGEAWTAAQVERGRNKSLEQILEEWATNAPFLEDALSAGTGPWESALDVVSHLCDIANAVGEAAQLPEGFLADVGAKLRRGFERGVVESGGQPISLLASDFDVFRGRFGRRTRAEVLNFPWSRDASDCVDRFFIFGVAENSLNEVAPAD